MKVGRHGLTYNGADHQHACHSLGAQQRLPSAPPNDPENNPCIKGPALRDNVGNLR